MKDSFRFIKKATHTFIEGLIIHKQITPTPDTVRNTCFHRRSNFKGFMKSHEIIIEKIKMDSSLKIAKFFRKAISEARKSAHLHAHGQVLTFNVARGDCIRVRIA